MEALVKHKMERHKKKRPTGFWQIKPRIPHYTKKSKYLAKTNATR